MGFRIALLALVALATALVRASCARLRHGLQGDPMPRRRIPGWLRGCPRVHAAPPSRYTAETTLWRVRSTKIVWIPRGSRTGDPLSLRAWLRDAGRSLRSARRLRLRLRSPHPVGPVGSDSGGARSER